MYLWKNFSKIESVKTRAYWKVVLSVEKKWQKIPHWGLLLTPQTFCCVLLWAHRITLLNFQLIPAMHSKLLYRETLISFLHGFMHVLSFPFQLNSACPDLLIPTSPIPCELSANTLPNPRLISTPQVLCCMVCAGAQNTSLPSCGWEAAEGKYELQIRSNARLCQTET